MRFAANLAVLLCTGLGLAGAARAQEQAPVLLEPVGPADAMAAGAGTTLAFTIGAGAVAAPGYFGSDELVLSPAGSFGDLYLNFGGREFGTSDPWAVSTGLDFGASLRFIGERSAALYPELAGLATIDPALELGGKVTFAQPSWQVFAEVRRGIGGHEALVGDLGADLIARPTDALTLTAGPRFFLGSDDYAVTYFGVTPAEAAASGFNAFEAEGGLLGAGVSLGASYDLGGNWGLNGAVSWERLQGSAADSPISQQGSVDQFSAGLVATRRFSLEF